MLETVAKETQFDPPVLVRLTREALKRVDDFRFAARAPSRAEAIRALIEEGLANQKKAAQRVASVDRE